MMARPQQTIRRIVAFCACAWHQVAENANPNRTRHRAAAIVVCIFLCSMAVDAEEQGPDAVIDEIPITAGDRDHWSFRPRVRPALPGVRRADWPCNAIDYFVLAQLEAHDLQPAPAADRTTWLRRLSFDLRGLPPSPSVIDRFAADDRPDAVERVVAAQLADPAYGEHWAQYWLDLARFAETDGFEHDKVRPTAWRYRDWVIDAWNRDMPFDEFVRWQIAGDVMQVDDPASALATAFCVSGADMPDINSQAERKHFLLNDMTSTVGSVFLGLQIGCAQCHDHMFDPISQADFYRLRAFFEPALQVKRDQSITMLSGETDRQQPSHLMIRGDWRRPGPDVTPAYPRIANSQSAVVVADDRLAPRAQLANWLTQADQPLTARVFVNRLWQYHFGRGLSDTPSDVGVMGDAPSHSDLLDWLACELVDSGWQVKRLQRLIVTSATYRQASMPTEQTDKAAWIKSLQRDPNAALLSRFPHRRLDAEVIRDAMYAASGSLNRQMGGPGVRPPLPPELVETLLRDQWTVSPRIANHYRRSVYVFARRNLRYPLFAAFDRPAAISSCARRSESTTAPQSLLLLNSAISLDAARRLAGVVWDEAGRDPMTQITSVYRRTLGRRPTALESDQLQEFCRAQAALLAAEGRTEATLALPITQSPIAATDSASATALTDLCLAIINSSEFLYLD